MKYFIYCLQKTGDEIYDTYRTNLEEKEILRKALKKLKKRERILLDMQFGLTGTSCSQQEIAEFFGVSQSTISREKIRILLRLREEFGD